MQENRNASFLPQQTNNGSGNGTVCIDTQRVFDCCRDRDCYEDVRVYLTTSGESILANSSNLRTRTAKLIWAYVGVDEVPFNCGFYRITIRYYVEVEFEACVAVGRSQTFKGLCVLEKDVVLYGGEGKALSFTSTNDNYCCIPEIGSVATNSPVAILETVEPVILGTKVNDCGCSYTCCDCPEIPECVKNCFCEDFVSNNQGPRIYVSFGVFSVVRIVRPAQLLVNATDYSVPDKECKSATNNENPCELFRTMAFPVNQFRGTDCPTDNTIAKNNGSCGCSGKK